MHLRLSGKTQKQRSKTQITTRKEVSTVDLSVIGFSVLELSLIKTKCSVILLSLNSVKKVFLKENKDGNLR